MQDFEGRQKLVAEIGLPPPDAGERRGRADHRAVAAHGAVVRLHAPDRGDDVAVDAIGLLDLIEHRLVFGQQLAAAGDALIVHQDVEIVPERLGELRLRVHQIHDAQVGREAADMLVIGGARDAALLRERPKAFEALLEIRRRLRGSRSPASADGRTSPDSPVHSRGGDGAGAVAATGGCAGAACARDAGTGACRPAAAAAGGRLARDASPAAPSSSVPANAIKPIEVECFGIVRSQSSLMSRQDHVRRLAQSLAVHWGKIWLSEG